MAQKRFSNIELNENYQKLIKEFDALKNQIDNYRTEVNEKVEGISIDYSDKEKTFNEFCNDKKIEIQEIENNHEQKLSEITTSIENKKEALDKYYFELFEKEGSIKENIDFIKTDLSNYHDEIFEGDSSEEALKERIYSVYRDLIKYRNEVFGTKKESEDGELIKIPGIKDEINKLVNSYEQEIENFKEKTEAIITEKEKKMDELLKKMNLNYNSVESEALSRKFFELSGEKEKAVNRSTFFLTSYSILLTGALIFLFTSKTLEIIFNGDNIIAGAIIRIAITTPLIYLIIATSNKLRREISIRDQYNFKGLLMSSYRNISTHMNNSDIQNPEIKQIELLDKVFNKILENEADKLDKSDEFNLKYISKYTGQLAKELGISKNSLISILPELIEKLKQTQKTEATERKKNTEQEQEQEEQE